MSKPIFTNSATCRSGKLCRPCREAATAPATYARWAAAGWAFPDGWGTGDAAQRELCPRKLDMVHPPPPPEPPPPPTLDVVRPWDVGGGGTLRGMEPTASGGGTLQARPGNRPDLAGFGRVRERPDPFAATWEALLGGGADRAAGIAITVKGQTVMDWPDLGRVLWGELHAWAASSELDAGGGWAGRAAWLARFDARIPCGECKQHWREWRAANPAPVARDNAALVAWAIRGHNAVNKRLGKPIWGQIVRVGLPSPQMAA